MLISKYLRRQFLTCLAALLLTIGNVFAIPFGIYDPRSLAMGGTGVAVATSINAVHYNPSLLAQYKNYKEKNGKQAISFPVIAGRVSKTLSDLSDINDRNYDSNISSAINTYNANQSIANASNALTTMQNLQNDLSSVSNKPILADINASLVIGIPSKHAGGAFYFLQRGVGDGNVNVTSNDSSLITDYNEALLFITSAGTQGSPHPELFNGGNLIDPVNAFTSNANARAAVITEIGVSIANTFKLFGSPVALSLKPKIYKIKTFDYSSSITNNAVDKQSNTDKQWNLSFDLAASYNMNKSWRIGLALKDLVAKDFQTVNGNTISIQPQLRFGIARSTSAYILTADIDLLANEGVFKNNKSQYLMLGFEMPVSSVTLRAGYRHALVSGIAKEEGIFSIGIGMNIKSFYFDFAYTENSEQLGAGLMFGFEF